MDSRSSLGADGKEQQGICVVESSSLSFFVKDGGDYVTSLPFQVSRAWKIKNGLLFEKTLTPAERQSPKKSGPSQTVVFSLLHPLDDVTPVITKSASPGGGPGKVSYLTDTNMTLIFTNSDPSLAFSYNSEAGVHSVWRIRSARSEEIDQFVTTDSVCFSRQFSNLSTVNA